MKKRTIALLGIVSVVIALAPPVQAINGNGTTQLAVRTSSGSPAGADIFHGEYSADGAYTAFFTKAANLVPNDTNGVWDVFIKNNATRAITRISIKNNGQQSTTDSYDPAISTDGRYVAFNATTDIEDAPPPNSKFAIYLYDAVAGNIRRIDRELPGSTDIFGGSNRPSISGDGRFITFASSNIGLTNDPLSQTIHSQIFVYDTATDAMQRITNSYVDGTGGDFDSGAPEISADGRFITYQSYARNLVPGLTFSKDAFQIYVYDRVQQTTRTLTTNAQQEAGNENSGEPKISADGRFIAYSSAATNIVPDPDGTVSDAFIYDQTTGVTERIGGNAFDPYATTVPNFISPDGRYVGICTTLDSYVTGDTNGKADALLYDRTTQTFTLLSITSNGQQGNGDSCPLSTTADGSKYLFESSSTNFTNDTQHNTVDLFDHYLADNVPDPLYDATPPTIDNPRLVPPVKFLQGTTQLHVTASDDQSGVIGGEYYIDTDPGQGNGIPMTGTSTLEATIGNNVPAGTHTVGVRALDAAGNWSAVKTVRLRVLPF